MTGPERFPFQHRNELIRARWHVIIAQLNIQQQHQTIAKLRDKGISTVVAETTLATLMSILEVFEHHERLLEKEIESDDLRTPARTPRRGVRH
jgi:hypothetical protein